MPIKDNFPDPRRFVRASNGQPINPQPVVDMVVWDEQTKQTVHVPAWGQIVPDDKMIPLTVHTVCHNEQRYNTVGDWCHGNVRVSALGNTDFEFLVAMHELVEMHLCRKRGVSEEAVTAFDKMYEATRLPGDCSEPGDHPDAPYHAEHAAATLVERCLATVLGVDWDEYEKRIQSLEYRPKCGS